MIGHLEFMLKNQCVLSAFSTRTGLVQTHSWVYSKEPELPRQILKPMDKKNSSFSFENFIPANGTNSLNNHLSQCMRFPTMWYVRPAKPQISLRKCAVWSEPLLVAWVFYDCYASDWAPFVVAKLKRRLQRLVWVYTCQNVTLLEITCTGSIFIYIAGNPAVCQVPKTRTEIQICVVSFQSSSSYT